MSERVSATKTNFPKSEYWVLSMLNPFLFIITTKFLNLTTASTENTGNHIAMTISYVPLPLRLGFFFPPMLGQPSASLWQSFLWWSVPYPASFCSYFHSVPPTSLFTEQHWQLQGCISGPVGREQGTSFIKPTTDYCNALGLPFHSPLTHPEQLPGLQAPFMVRAL